MKLKNIRLNERTNECYCFLDDSITIEANKSVIALAIHLLFLSLRVIFTNILCLKDHYYL